MPQSESMHAESEILIPFRPRLIKTQDDHRNSLACLKHLMESDPPPGSPDEATLELLAYLIEEYEKRSVPDIIRFHLARKGLQQKDLSPELGSRSHVADVMAGRRSLTPKLIRGLHSVLGIPLESLFKGMWRDAATPQAPADGFTRGDLLLIGHSVSRRIENLENDPDDKEAGRLSKSRLSEVKSGLKEALRKIDARLALETPAPTL